MRSASPYIGGISSFFPTAIDFAVNVLPFPSLARAKILVPGFSSERCPGEKRITGAPDGTDNLRLLPVVVCKRQLLAAGARGNHSVRHRALDGRRPFRRAAAYHCAIRHRALDRWRPRRRASRVPVGIGDSSRDAPCVMAFPRCRAWKRERYVPPAPGGRSLVLWRRPRRNLPS